MSQLGLDGVKRILMTRERAVMEPASSHSAGIAARTSGIASMWTARITAVFLVLIHAVPMKGGAMMAPVSQRDIAATTKRIAMMTTAVPHLVHAAQVTDCAAMACVSGRMIAARTKRIAMITTAVPHLAHAVQVNDCAAMAAASGRIVAARMRRKCLMTPPRSTNACLKCGMLLLLDDTPNGTKQKKTKHRNVTQSYSYCNGIMFFCLFTTYLMRTGRMDK